MDAHNIIRLRATMPGITLPLADATAITKRMASINRLTAMMPYMAPLFFELRTSFISFRIFVR